MNRAAEILFHSDEFDEIRKVELRILRIFDQICHERDIKYYAIYGTLLGAVRHKGFIPWDDDIDVAIFRKDIKKLLETDLSSYSQDLEFWNLYEGIDYQNNVIKLVNHQTTCINPAAFHECGKYGIHIDIEIIDNTYKWSALRKVKDRYLQKLFTKINWINYKGRENSDSGKLVSRLMMKIDKVLSLGSLGNSICSIYTNNQYPVLKAEWFEQSKRCKFEDIYIDIPYREEKCLEEFYGVDYLQLPEESERVPGHLQICSLTDTRVPYSETIEMLTSLKKSEEFFHAYVWGAGNMFVQFMNRFGERLKPIAVIDRNSNLWGTTVREVPVIAPNTYFEAQDEERPVIVCNIYCREIVSELRERGIRNIAVFWDEYYSWCDMREDKNDHNRNRRNGIFYKEFQG